MASKKAWVVLGAAALSGLLGNLVTAFGPYWTSWGKKPRFLDTQAYKTLSKAYPEIEQRLDAVFADAKPYYEYRRTKLELLSVNDSTITFCVYQSTRVVNIYDFPLTFSQPVLMSDKTQFEALRIDGPKGVEREYDFQTLKHVVRTHKAGATSAPVSFDLAASTTYNVSTTFRITKARLGQEAFVFGATIVKGYDFSVSVPTELRSKIAFEFFPMGFGVEPRFYDDQKGTLSTTFHGVFLSGHGIELNWKVDPEIVWPSGKPKKESGAAECVRKAE